jgi:hypothetical protein
MLELTTTAGRKYITRRLFTVRALGDELNNICPDTIRCAAYRFDLKRFMRQRVGDE